MELENAKINFQREAVKVNLTSPKTKELSGAILSPRGDEFGSLSEESSSGAKAVSPSMQYQFVSIQDNTDGALVAKFEDAFMNLEAPDYKKIAPLLTKIFFNQSLTKKEKAELLTDLQIDRSDENNFFSWLGNNGTAAHAPNPDQIHLVANNPLASYSEYLDSLDATKNPIPESDFVKAKVNNFMDVLDPSRVDKGEIDFLELITGMHDTEKEHKDFQDLRNVISEVIADYENVDTPKLATAARRALQGKGLSDKSVQESIEDLTKLGVDFSNVSDEAKLESIKYLDGLLNAESAFNSHKESSVLVAKEEKEKEVIDTSIKLSDVPSTNTYKGWINYLKGIPDDLKAGDRNKASHILSKLEKLESLSDTDRSVLADLLKLSGNYPEALVARMAERVQKGLDADRDAIVKLGVSKSDLPETVKLNFSAQEELNSSLPNMVKNINEDAGLKLKYARAYNALSQTHIPIDENDDDVKSFITELGKNGVDLSIYDTKEKKDSALRTMMLKVANEFVDGTATKYDVGTNTNKEKQTTFQLVSAMKGYLNNYPNRADLASEMERFFGATNLGDEFIKNLSDKDLAIPLDFLSRGKGDPAIQNALLKSLLDTRSGSLDIANLFNGKLSIDEISSALPQMLQEAAASGAIMPPELIDASKPTVSETIFNSVPSFNFVPYRSPANPAEVIPANQFFLDMDWDFLYNPGDEDGMKANFHVNSDGSIDSSVDEKSVPENMMNLLKTVYSTDEAGVMEMINTPSISKIFLDRDDADKLKKGEKLSDVNYSVFIDPNNLLKLVTDGITKVEKAYSGEGKANFPEALEKRKALMSLMKENNIDSYFEVEAPAVYSPEKYDEELRAFMYNLELFINHFNKNVVEPYSKQLDESMRLNPYGR